MNEKLRKEERYTTLKGEAMLFILLELLELLVQNITRMMLLLECGAF